MIFCLSKRPMMGRGVYVTISERAYETFLLSQERELRQMLKTWKGKQSKTVRKINPEFARGYMTALEEILG